MKVHKSRVEQKKVFVVVIAVVAAVVAIVAITGTIS